MRISHAYKAMHLRMKAGAALCTITQPQLVKPLKIQPQKAGTFEAKGFERPANCCERRVK